MSGLSGRERWQPYVGIVALMVVTRLAAVLVLHLAPSDYLLRAFLHLLPLDVLLERPVEGIWNLHAQPPLYNVLVALMVQALHSTEAVRVAWGLYFVNCAFSALGACAGFTLVRNLSGSGRSAAVAACLLVLNPAALLYELWPLYASLSSCVFLSLACAAERFIASKGSSLGWALSVVVSLCAASLANSKMPPVVSALLCSWVGLTVARQQRLHWSRWVMLGAPLAVVAFFQVKNVVVFDTYSLSSISGCNFVRAAPARALAQIDSGGLPLGAFGPITIYRPGLPDDGPIPELDRVMKRDGADEFININHRQYPGVCRELAGYAVRAISADPVGYLANVARSFVLYFNASSRHFSLNQNGNYDALRPYERHWDGVLFYGRDVTAFYRPPYDLIDHAKALTRNTVRLTVFMWLALALYGWLLWRSFHGGADMFAMRALGLLLLGHLAVSIGFEIRETARFKFDVEGIYLCLFVVMARQTIGALRAAFNRRRSSA